MRYFLCCLSLLALSATALVSLPKTVPAALAQTTDPRQDKADRLLNQGIEQYDRSQYLQALETLQQALAFYQQLDDRAGQGKTLNKLGDVYRNLSQYTQAIDYHQQSLAIAQEVGDRVLVGNALRGLGSAYRNLGDYAKAIDFHQKALAIFRKIGNRAGEGKALRGLGAVSYFLGDTTKAIDYFQQALAIARDIGDRAGEGKALTGLGNAYFFLGDYAKAIDFYQQSLAIAGEIDDRAGEGRTLGNLGTAYYSLGDYTKAIDFYQQSLTIAREIGDRAGEGQVLGNLGAAYNFLGDYAKAIDFYQQSLAIARAIGDRAGEKINLLNLGLAYTSLGDYAQAIDYNQQGLAIVREIGDRAGEGTVLGNLGSVYFSLGDYAKATDVYQQRLAIAREIGDWVGEGNTLSHLGVAYKHLGNYAKAIGYYQQALVIFRQLGDHAKEGTILGSLGNAYRSLGDYAQAIDYHQKHLAIAQQIRDLAEEGIVLGNLGNVYDSLGDYDKAINYHQQALAIFRQIDNNIGKSTVLGNLGSAYDSLEDYAKAIDYHQQALAIFRQSGDRAGEGRTLHNLAVAYKNLEQYDRASDFYQQSLVLFQQTKYREAEGFALSNLGSLLAQQNQPELAIVFYKQAVNLREQLRQEQRQQNLATELQQSYTDTVAGSYRKLADLLLQQDRVLEAQQVLDLLKVQELEDYLRQVRGTGQQLVELPPEREILAKYNALQKTAIHLGQERSQLRKLASNDRLTPQQEQRLAQLVELEADLKRQFNQFIDRPDVIALVEQLNYKVRRQSVDLADLDALRDDLRRLDAVMLYPLILEDRLELVITTPDSPPLRRTVKVSREELNQAIARFRSSLVNASRTNLPPAQQLYDWLVRPIEADLAQAGAKTIIYAPDGQLRYIPLAALHDGEQWLVQRFRINNITAKSFTNLDRQPAKQLRVLAGAFADEQTEYAVQAGGKTFEFTGLPFAGKEVELLAKTLPDTNTFLDRDFSLAKLRPTMNSREVLHLATHAMFVPGQPEESFILFGDGQRATLTDIRDWTLTNVDLVVLSACETGLGGKGLGNGAEILGLGYQFQQSGARATVASLWQVSDGGTQALMNAFYAALQRGMTKAEALRQAQIALITGDYSAVGGQRASLAAVPKEGGAVAQSGLAHPYYWAPFILIGNGL